MGVLMSVWHYDMPAVCFNLFDILKMCGERKTHNPPSGVSHKVFHCHFVILHQELLPTMLGVVVVGIISDCGRRGEGVLTTAVAIAIVMVAGVVDDLTGYLPVVALTAMLGVVILH